MPEARVVIVDCNYEPDNPHIVFVEMRSILSRHGIELTVDHCWSEDYPGFDLIIGADPLVDHPSLSGSRILGQRTLNRKTRLDVADRCGAPVAPYGSPTDDAGLDALARTWKTSELVLKYDWSARRNGVFRWSLDPAVRKPFPIDFNPESDVFMAFLDADPITYKVDAFGGVVLGAHTLATQDMRVPNWQAIKDIRSHLFSLPGDVERDIAVVSRALLQDGAGYSSFDLMRDGSGFSIIEMNTCGVGTGPWINWPDQYSTRYAEGIVAVLEAIDTIPTYGQLRNRAIKLGNDDQAPQLPVRQSALDDGSQSGPDSDSITSLVDEHSFLAILEQSETADMPGQLQQILAPLQDLVSHAAENVPFYANRFKSIISGDGALDLQGWHNVPILSRHELATHRSTLIARRLPPNHGAVWFSHTEGTEGEPLTISRSRLAAGAAACIECRSYKWHGLDFSDPVARILTPSFIERPADTKWAPAWITGKKGNHYELSSALSVGEQLSWLQSLGPVWLRTRPSIAQVMAFAVADEPDLKPELLGLITVNEILTRDQRALINTYLGLDPINMYRSAEAGIIAVQCPQTNALHVQQEVVYVEILKDNGMPCSAGETGRVVITPLYNLAMPLIRYDTGDIAVAADEFRTLSDTECACGRRLPRLNSVLGRKRNCLRFPGTSNVQPDLDSRQIRDLSGAVLWQLRQKSTRQATLVLDEKSCRADIPVRQLADILMSRLGGQLDLLIEKADLAAQAAAGRHEAYRYGA